MNSVSEKKADSQPSLCSTSKAFHAKENLAPVRWSKKRQQYDNRWALGAFDAATLESVRALADHFERGHAVGCAQFRDNWRHGKNFIQSNVLFVDIDNKIFVDEYGQRIRRRAIDPATGKVRTFNYLESPMSDEEAAELLQHPLIAHCAIVQESASSKPGDRRFHLIFILDEPITDPEKYRSLTRRLQSQFRRADPTVKDAARFFYGSLKSCVIVQERTIPITLLEAIPDPQAHRAPTAAARNTSAPYTSDDLQRRVEDALSHIPPNPGYDIWVTIIAALYSAFDVSTAESILERWSGHYSKPGEIREKLESLGSHSNPATIATVFYFAKQHGWTPPWKRRKVKVPVRQRDIPTPPATGDAMPVNRISDDLTPEVLASVGDVLIAGPTGQGKTHAAAEYANRLPDGTRITGVAQYRLLTRALSKILIGSHHYGDTNSARQSALGLVDRLVTSLSSLHKFNRRGGILIVDEIEGCFDFITNSATFKPGEMLTSWREFEDAIKSADQFIGMDANLSDIVIDEIKRLRPGVTVKRYTSDKPRGKVKFLRGRTEAFYMVEKLLRKRRGQVYVACSSEEIASQLIELFGAYRVLKITRDTSNTPEVQAFIRSAEARQTYDLVVYTSAMGAGVDISEPVYARVGIFDRTPLAPEHAIQLYGRVRNAQLSYAAVPPYSDGYQTPTADELKTEQLKRELWTAARTGREADISGDYLKVLDIWSRFEARRRRETAQWRVHFARRLKENGYIVQANNASAPQAFADALSLWRKERKKGQQDFVLKVVDPLPDKLLDTLRMRGVEISRELNLRNVRYHIERALGHPNMTDQDFELMDERGRQRLFRLIDLLTSEDDLLAADRTQAEKGCPLQKRYYAALNVHEFSRLLTLAELPGTPEAQFMAFVEYFHSEHSAEEVSERFAVFATPEAARLFEALGHRGNNARTVTGRCRWLLEYLLGSSVLSSRQRRIDGTRPTFYKVDMQLVTYRMKRARRAAALHREMSKNVYSEAKSTFLDTLRTPHFGPTREVGRRVLTTALPRGPG